MNNLLKKYSALYIFILLSGFTLSSCIFGNNKQGIPTPTMTPSPTKSLSEAIKGAIDAKTGPVVSLNTKDGQIVIRLYEKEAPKSVANFIQKADNGFYNNLTFHRVETGFVVQGGDPKGNGTGGGKITSEINTIPFKRGSVGLARGMEKEVSNDSQFFICLADEQCQHLTNEYVNFGEVIYGMELVDKIAIGDKILSITSKTK